MAGSAWWAEFRTGLLRPSVTAIASASGTVLALALLFTCTLGPAWLTHGRVRWLASDVQDDYAFVTATVLDAPPAPGVIVLGASGTREAFTDEADLEARLGVDVLDLTTDAQTLVEARGLISAVPVDGSIVLYGVGPHMLELKRSALRIVYDNPRLGFHSPVIDAEFERLGWAPRPQTGWPAIDQRNFFMLRLPYLPLNLLRGGVDRQQHRYLGESPLPPEAFPTHDWQTTLAALEENHPMHLGTLERLVEGIEARHGEVILVYAPVWTDWFRVPAEAARYALSNTLFEAFAAERDLPLWRPMDEAGLTQQDFRDPSHLSNAEAQERFTAAVVTRLFAQRLKGSGPQGGARDE